MCRVRPFTGRAETRDTGSARQRRHDPLRLTTQPSGGRLRSLEPTVAPADQLFFALFLMLALMLANFSLS